MRNCRLKVKLVTRLSFGLVWASVTIVTSTRRATVYARAEPQTPLIPAKAGIQLDLSTRRVGAGSPPLRRRAGGCFRSRLLFLLPLLRRPGPLDHLLRAQFD